MKTNFAAMKGVVLRALGVKEFTKDASGKEILLDDQKAVVKEKFSEGFASKFEVGLSLTDEQSEEQITAAAEALEALKQFNAPTILDLTNQVNAATQRAIDAEAAKAALEADNATMKETIDILAGSADDSAAEMIVSKGGVVDPKAEVWYGVKPNAKYFHNRMGFGYRKGDTGMAMAASTSSFGRSSDAGASANTINVDEVANEFGTYLSQMNIRLDILQKLVQKTESQQYMTTKMAITEWRATSALITSVVQQWFPEWTPAGSTKFSPITIRNRHHKVNLPIKPDDINDSWLSYLYDEQVTPDQMPVTRYIIEKLLRPAIDRDIESLMIATGKFEELPEGMKSGDVGQAAGKSMDGYVTILKDQKKLVDTKINFFTPSVAITADTIVDVIEEYADWLEDQAPLYAKSGMNIFIDPKLKKQFDRKYRELYPTTKNQDGSKNAPDFSNLTFVALEAMRGTGTFFSTPKENFIRLIHKNAAGGETKLWLQVQDYNVKVFAEFWLGVGFAMADLVWAYVPVEASGSGA